MGSFGRIYKFDYLWNFFSVITIKIHYCFIFNFYDDCLNIWKKALNQTLTRNKDYEDLEVNMGNHFFQILAQRYQKIASLYIKKKSFKNALLFTEKALESHHKSFEIRTPLKWEFTNGKLIPLSKDEKELFYTKSGRIIIWLQY